MEFSNGVDPHNYRKAFKAESTSFIGVLEKLHQVGEYTTIFEAKLFRNGDISQCPDEPLCVLKKRGGYETPQFFFLLREHIERQ